MSVYIIKTMK